MPKRQIRHKGGVPLHVLKTREKRLEWLIDRRESLGEVPGKIPVDVLRMRLHRLRAHILNRG